MTNLWNANPPRKFWQCQPDPVDDVWKKAITEALPALGLSQAQQDIDTILALTLGESRFGSDHWRLSLPKRMYYILKPILPRALTSILRRLYSRFEKADANLRWPVESRYAEFLWEIMTHLLRTVPEQQLYMKSLWPDNFRYAFILTHDVESAIGQSFIHAVADLEESLGFRSSFNFVPEGYRIDMDLVDELRNRGFEIGIHGLKHDGKLFSSRIEFERRVVRINQYLKELSAVGFRAPLTMRNPEWMQLLNIEYDLSFFDTDPFEPIPGGTMSIWPFFLGHFVELPYTLVQDYTLTSVRGETTPRLWLEKTDFIEKYHGMALLNSHPDYLREPANIKIYSTFLSTMQGRNDYWHALPHDVARWWRTRVESKTFDNLASGDFSTLRIVDGNLQVV
jgi:peptidoglycan/xylan/chitin deacetylase (PgdA/CDA1 family)